MPLDRGKEGSCARNAGSIVSRGVVELHKLTLIAKLFFRLLGLPLSKVALHIFRTFLLVYFHPCSQKNLANLRYTAALRSSNNF